jgi:hypothetical protein
LFCPLIQAQYGDSEIELEIPVTRATRLQSPRPRRVLLTTELIHLLLFPPAGDPTPFTLNILLDTHTHTHTLCLYVYYPSTAAFTNAFVGLLNCTTIPVASFNVVTSLTFTPSNVHIHTLSDTSRWKCSHRRRCISGIDEASSFRAWNPALGGTVPIGSSICEPSNLPSFTATLNFWRTVSSAAGAEAEPPSMSTTRTYLHGGCGVRHADCTRGMAAFDARRGL